MSDEQQKEQGVGASASEPGSREPSPASGLGPAGFDPSREIMSPAFAVFNGHINNADKRARAAMAEQFPSQLSELEALEREGGGIMHVFSVCGLTWGSRAARRYIEMVTTFVNEDRDSDGSRNGRDAQRLDGNAATARAEGIAQPSQEQPQ